MKKKFILFIVLIISSLLFISCTVDIDDDEEVILPCVHVVSEFIYNEEKLCGVEQIAYKKCLLCEEVLEKKPYVDEHDFYEVKDVINCTARYYVYTRCHNCDYETFTTELPSGHNFENYVITKEPTDKLCGIKQLQCSTCNHLDNPIEFAGNDFSYHGKLSVVGPDLVDENNQKFQLIGISTHGLQWFGRYVTKETFKALKEEFGINVIRLAMYTAEDGYVTGNATRRKYMYDTVVKGIEIATELDMYVIVDWHMVGATLESDKNPLTFVNESMDFFKKISEKFKDYDNVIYEIMNEPNGGTTWDHCKEYALQVIPVIRENSDGIILVGNPKWTSDLDSVSKDPLVGFDNIMYTYHFYAASHKSTVPVTSFYDKGLPVFISEHGGMHSSGDLEMDYNSVRNWYKELDKRNISYVAWNLSNSKGSASILKQTNYSLTDFSDNGLKVWGRFYKIITRSRANLTVYTTVDEENEKK